MSTGRCTGPGRRSHGLSMIELMVAIALSTLLILGLVEIFGSTRGAFAASQALARVQENSRFGLDYLRRDLRMAGHLGCLNEFGHADQPSSRRFFNHFNPPADPFSSAAYVLQADAPLEIYEYSGTAPTDTFDIAAGAPVLAAGPNSYTPPIPNDLWARLSGRAVAGSDVLVSRFAEEYPLVLRDYLVTGDGIVRIEPEDADRAVHYAPYLVTNCKEVSLFQLLPGATLIDLASEGGLNVEVSGGIYWGNSEVYAAGSLLMRYRYSAYFVGANGQGATSLYRVGLRENPGNANEGILLDPAEELVEGVEMLQALVGLVNPPPYSELNPREDYVSTYSSVSDLVAGYANRAALLERLQRVISVRVSMLMRSPEVGAGAPPVNPVILVGDVEVTVPPDRFMRHVYESTIAVRNRVRN